jgi:signal peptidase I
MQYTKQTAVTSNDNVHKNWKAVLIENVRFILIVLAIVIPVRAFIAQPFLVRGDSMIPTFHNSDYLIVDELSYRFQSPKRGDVVVFRMPDEKNKKFLIKRIIGLPGDTLRFNTDTVTIVNTEHPKGVTIREPYISLATFSTGSEIKLDSDSYFVMGDNRPNSYDSRAWGPLKRSYITGRVMVRLFHFNRIGLWPGVHSYSQFADPEKPTTTK